MWLAAASIWLLLASCGTGSRGSDAPTPADAAVGTIVASSPPAAGGCPTIASFPMPLARAGTPPSGAVAASAWPVFQHDARHSSTSTATGPQNGHVRWQRRLEGNVTPAPVIGADGAIYAASNGGVLHALDPATGDDRWTFDGGGGYGSDLSTAAAVMADGTILWPGPRDTLFALDAGGALLWSR